MVRLFDVQDGKVIPTEHCYTLDTLKAIMTAYPDRDEHMAAYAYVFYKTCPNPDLNPFFDLSEDEKDEMILSQVGGSFGAEDDEIRLAIIFCAKLYQTPTYKAYMGIKAALERLANFMYATPITDGRDGNIMQIVNTAKAFDPIRLSFNGAYRDLKEEQNSNVRGGQRLAYDQT